MFSTDLLPVQVLFLQNPSKMKIEDAITIILRDLTLRRVLNLVKIQSYPNDRSRKTQKYFRFIKGANYEGYEAAPCEKIFIVPFSEIDYIQAKVLTNFVLKKYSIPSGYINEKIYAPLHTEGYISGLPILRSFGYYSVSNKGKEIVSAVNNFLSEQEQKLESLIDGDKMQFAETLIETGVYAFYYEFSNPELYKNIISMVKRIIRPDARDAYENLDNFAEAINVDLGYFAE